MSAETSPRPRRADARRNVEAILDAAARLLAIDPDASMGDIAAAADVGRVTVYAHFESRTELVRAVVIRAIARGEEAAARIDLTGEPRESLRLLIDSSWQQIVEIGAVMAAAAASIDAAELRRMHDAPAQRVLTVVRRGRHEGAFRTDLPESWLVGVLHMLMNGAAVEVREGRLEPEDAAHAIAETALAAYRPAG